jgi:HD-GYP domain-containing protein (c-di-GMP phosphodiesterase class II)
MSLFVFAGIAVLGVLAGVFIGLWIRYSYRRRWLEMNAALETGQRKTDHQMARSNILLRILPDIQVAVATHPTRADWQSVMLEQGRTLLQADTAEFWRYQENSQSLLLENSRGASRRQELGVVVELEKVRGCLRESTLRRLPVVGDSGDDVIGTLPALAVPLVVSGRLWGVFRFFRGENEVLGTRDRDVISVLVQQLALALECREQVVQREKFYLELVQTLADVLDEKDASVPGQTREARRLARGIARELDMPDEFIYYLEFAALLHDIGKIAIDDSLLKKPSRLSDEEYAIIKKHPEIGHRILSPVSMLAPVAPMVLYHQEWYDGHGYPEGLSGEEIPLGARIVAVLDAWNAMTCDRPWRPARPRADAIKEIQKAAGTQFDPHVVEAFLTTLQKLGVSEPSPTKQTAA